MDLKIVVELKVLADQLYGPGCVTFGDGCGLGCVNFASYSLRRCLGLYFGEYMAKFAKPFMVDYSTISSLKLEFKNMVMTLS